MSATVCPKCGLNYDTISPADGKVAVRSFPRRYRAALAAALEDEGDEAIVRRRPAPDVWSALEYTAHVADVFAGTAGWVDELRTRDRPSLTIGKGAAFEQATTGTATAESALTDLASAAERLAAALDKVATDDWSRVGTFPWGEGDLLGAMRNAVHEGSHHLRDVERVLDDVRGRA